MKRLPDKNKKKELSMQTTDNNQPSCKPKSIAHRYQDGAFCTCKTAQAINKYTLEALEAAPTARHRTKPYNECARSKLQKPVSLDYKWIGIVSAQPSPPDADHTREMKTSPSKGEGAKATSRNRGTRAQPAPFD